MEKIEKYMPTPMVLMAFILGFIGILTVKLPVFQDPDISWHILAGYDIRERGWVPSHDPWSFTEKMQEGGGQVWYNISWIWDIVLSYVHQGFGVEGLFIFAKMMPALVVAMQVYFLQKRGIFGNNAVIFTALITTFCMMEDAYGRPQVLGLMLAFVFHHFLHKSRKNNNEKGLLLLPLFMILWANVHGSLFMGFAALGAFGLEAIYTKNWKWLFKLLLVSVLCVLAVMVNPHGIFVITGIMRTMKSALNAYNVDWRPFVFGHIIGATMWIGVFVLVSNMRLSDAPLADKILAVIFLFGTFFSVRNMSFLTIYGAPYLAANMPPDDEKSVHTRRLSAWINNKRYSPALLVLCPVLLMFSYLILPIMGNEYYYEIPKNSPLSAIEYVKKHYADKRILNDYNLGGRFLYETGGKIPVFIDGRAGTAYSEKMIADYLSFFDLTDDWEKNIDKYKVDVLLLMNTTGFVYRYKNGQYHDKWEEVFHGDAASVYVRRDKKK